MAATASSSNVLWEDLLVHRVYLKLTVGVLLLSLLCCLSVTTLNETFLRRLYNIPTSHTATTISGYIRCSLREGICFYHRCRVAVRHA